MPKTITLNETGMNLLADYRKANEAFYAAKDLFNAIDMGNQTAAQEAIKDYNKASDVMLQAAAVFADCVESSIVDEDSEFVLSAKTLRDLNQVAKNTNNAVRLAMVIQVCDRFKSDTKYFARDAVKEISKIVKGEVHHA